MMLNASPSRMAVAAIALACTLAGAPAVAQDAVTPAELHQITCHVLDVPEVRAAVDAGAGPLLVVSGREIGPLRRPAAPCPERARLPRGLTEFRIIRPHAAPQLFGERGRNGAVLVDLPPVRR